MKVVVKVTSRTIYTKDEYGNNDNFRIVKAIPEGFFIWNIGKNMGTDEYIPLCEDLNPDDKEDFSINTKTLKAIKLPADEVALLREAAQVGVNSLETAQKALRSKRKGYWTRVKKGEAEKTIDIFRRITA